MEIDAISKADVKAVKSMFVDAAVRAAHGFFLSRFISLAYNHRSDEYGGNTENRGRIILEILCDVKKKYPELHVTMKINCNDFIHGGLTPEDSMTMCRLCADTGMDSIEVSGNGTSVPGI